MLPRSNLGALVERAAALAARGRVLLGITGGPGAGKSELAQQLVAALPQRAVLVPMDGFHLAQDVLAELGRTATKGAIDTFDVAGFVHLLRRLRPGAESGTVYAPTFRRDLEEPVGGAVAVRPAVPLVIVEGNYLLAEQPGWVEVGPLLDEVWFLQPPEDVRLDRLVARHVQFGRDLASARERALGSDLVNARIIAGTAARADVLVTGC